jgi:hypothetical protein
MLSQKDESVLLEKFLTELGQVRMFALDAIKEAINSANVGLITAQQATDFDQFWAEVGIAGSFFAVVGTVVAVVPVAGALVAGAGTTLVVGTIEGWAVTGAGVSVTGGLVNVLGGYEQNLNKPGDIRQGTIDSMKQSIVGAIDAAREHTFNHLDQFANLRNGLYKQYKHDSEYGFAFASAEDPDLKRHSKRVELIWTKLFRRITPGMVARDQCTQAVKDMAWYSLKDLIETIKGTILPDFLVDNRPTKMRYHIEDGVRVGELVPDGPEPARDFASFTKFMKSHKGYIDWGRRHRVAAELFG